MFDQYPIMTGFDHLVGANVAAIVLVGLFIATRRSPDRVLIRSAFILKLLGCYAMCAMTMPVFGGGDMIGYHHHGCRYADMLRGDLVEGTSQYLTKTPFYLPVGNNVERCWSLSGLVHFFVFDSYIASSVVFATIGFAGQLLLFRTFVSAYPDPRLRKWWAANLFMPSLTFWTGTLMKDPIGFWALGCATWGAYRLLIQGNTSGLVRLGVGVYALGLFRAQVAPVFLIAIGPMLLGSLSTAGGHTRRIPFPIRLGLSLVLAFASVFVLTWLGTLDSRISLEGTNEALFAERKKYLLVKGGSTIVTTDEVLQQESSSFLGTVLLWPAMVMYTLFQPTLLEGFQSPIMMFAAIENTVLLAMTLRLTIRSIARPRAIAGALGSPLFLPCLIFVALFAYCVGLSTPNLGTLSRYRIPLIPFVVGVMGILEFYYGQSRQKQKIVATWPG